MNILRSHVASHVYIPVFVLVCLYFSCSGADPVIYDMQWTLQAVSYDPSRIGIAERLVLYILADDEDGFEEIYELYVIHDDSDIYWRVTSDEWKEFSIDNKTWIGVNALTREDKIPLPRGNYRVLLRDLSGYEDEQKFTLSEKSSRYTIDMMPRLQFEEDGLYIPLFGSGAEAPTGFVQFAHPYNSTDSVKDASIESNMEYIRSLLGDDGMLYEIKHGVPIMFDSQETTQFSLYVHYRKNDKLMLSSGPYDISLK